MKSILLILMICSTCYSIDYPYEDKIPESIHPLLHFAIPFVTVCSVNYILTKLYPDNHIMKNVTISTAIGVSEGVGKELFDMSRGYKFSYSDMLYAFGGVFVAEGIYITFKF